MRDVEVQKLMDIADDLRKSGKYKEATGVYLDALRLMKSERESGNANELWCKKVIFMACNGMGIAYSKLGFQTDALDNFADAVEHAPNDRARAVAMSNLEKLGKALKNKTGVEFKFHFIE